jgi:hypothetical protein
MVLVISSVSGIVNVICLVIPAAVCLLILGFLGAIIVALSGLNEVQIIKCGKTVSLYTLEGTNTRASGIRGCFPQLMKYQDFFSINSMLK